MADNPFDQFDTPSATANPFDQFDKKEPTILEKAKKTVESAADTVLKQGGLVDLRKFLTPERALQAVTTDVSKKIGAPIVKDVSYHPEMVGSQSIGNYAKAAAKGGMEGLIGGAGVAPFVGGPGGIVGGAGLGALQGLAETAAADLGLSPDLQKAAGIVGPAAAGLVLSKIPQTPQQVNSALSNDAMNSIKSKIASKAINKALGLPYWTSSIIEKVPKVFQGFAEKIESPDYQTVGKTLGAKPETIGKTEFGFTKQAQQELASEHPTIEPSEKGKYSTPLYEQAKNAYNEAAAEEPFTSSPEFKSLTKDIPAEKTKFSKLFQNPEKEDLVGEDVVNNLHYNSPHVSDNDMNRAREAFNKYLTRTTGADHEQIAREAYMKESIAAAKDSLPIMFEENDSKGIKKQLWNLSKEPEGKALFNDELTYHLKNTNVNQAKSLWNKIGKDVKDSFGMDDETYKTVTNAIEKAKTPQEIDRATRIMKRFAGPALGVSVTNKKEENE
jgi:hypothetical protein